MRGHLILAVPKPTQRLIKRVLTEWPVANKTRERQPTAARYLPRFIHDRNRLTAQRDYVLFSHLGSAGGDAPYGGIEVKFRPLSVTQLTGTHEHVWSQPQRVAGPRLPFVALNRPQQRAYLRRVNDGGMVRHLGSRQRADQVSRNITFAACGRDPVPEHAASEGPNPSRRLISTLRLQGLQHRQQLERLDFRDGPPVQPLKFGELPVELHKGRLRHSFAHALRDQRFSHRLERVPRAYRSSEGSAFLLSAWVTAFRQRLPRLVPPLARVCQGHVGVCAQRQELFLALPAVFEPPEPATRGADKQEQAVRVVHLVLSRLGLCRPDGGVRSESWG